MCYLFCVVMPAVSFWGYPCFQRILAYMVTLISDICSALLQVPRLSHPVQGHNIITNYNA